MFRTFALAPVLASLLAIAPICTADDDVVGDKAGDRPKNNTKNAAQADLKQLRGEWVAVDGDKVDMELMFDGETFILKENEREIHCTIAVDATKTPKTMDLTVTGGTAGRDVDRFKDKVSKAIYKLSADQFEWCANEPGNEARPTVFSGDEPGIDALYIVFKRKGK